MYGTGTHFFHLEKLSFLSYNTNSTGALKKKVWILSTWLNVRVGSCLVRYRYRYIHKVEFFNIYLASVAVGISCMGPLGAKQNF